MPIYRPLFLLTLLLSLSGASIAAEAPKGQSQELGIEFSVKGGVSWCGQDVQVELLSKRQGKFQLDAEAFVKMTMRLRAVVQSECPAVERIRFTALSPGDPVYFEVTRLAAWARLVRLSSTGALLCSVNTPCERRVVAYELVHKFLRGEQFSNFTLLPQDEKDAHVTWRVGDVIGRIAPLDLMKLGVGEVPKGEVGNVLAAALAASCVRGRGEAEQLEAQLEKVKTALHMVRCKSDVHVTSTAVFTTEYQTRIMAVSLTGMQETEDQILAIAGAIAVGS